MKVILLSINAKYVHSSLAVWYLASGVAQYAKYPYDVQVVEATINQRVEEIAERVILENPDVVGISTYIWNARKLPDLLARIRCALPGVRIVLGGPEASCNPEHWVENGADYVLCGEGERSFPQLLDALAEEDTERLEQVAGLCYCREKPSSGRPLDHSASLSDAKRAVYKNQSPSSHEYVDPFTADYFAALGGRIAYIETSRGCPYRCAYCLSGSSVYGFEQGVRFFSLERVKEQIAKLADSGTQTIKFVDRTFNCNQKRAYDIWKYIIDMQTDCCFHFEVAGDLFDAKSLALLQSAPPGRIQLEVGLQSFHEPTLSAVARQTDIAVVQQNLRELLRQQNIHVHVDLIAGLPYETLGIFEKSFNQAYTIGAHTLQLGFLKLIHGSRLREQARELGMVYDENPPYEIVRNPWLDEADLAVLRLVENAISHTYNKGRFLFVLQYVLAVSGQSAFAFFRGLGESVSNHAMQLDVYAERVFAYCLGQPGVEADRLRDLMIRDLLGMTKGKCMPSFLKAEAKWRKQVVAAANLRFGRVVDFDEVAVLSSGEGVYADSETRNKVTGLYAVYSASGDI